MSVCGEADCQTAARQGMVAVRPDVGIIDLGLKCGNGLELIKELRALGLGLKLVVFTMQDEGVYAERVLRAGADGFVSKEEETEKLIQAIRAVMGGRRFFPEPLIQRTWEALLERRCGPGGVVGRLSAREREVLTLLGSGLGSRESAHRLGVSMRTIQSHRAHIKAKLGLARAAELMSYALQWCRGQSSAVCPHPWGNIYGAATLLTPGGAAR